MSEGEGEPQDKAYRVLLAAIVEAEGLSLQSVERQRVMRRANISDEQEFRAVAEDLGARGLLVKEDEGWYRFFVTSAGIEEAARSS
jgi:hypothetical protein